MQAICKVRKHCTTLTLAGIACFWEHATVCKHHFDGAHMESDVHTVCVDLKWISDEYFIPGHKTQPEYDLSVFR